MTTADVIKANWKEIKGKVKQQWGKLTDDDITYMDGSYDSLVGNLQEKYGYGKDQVRKEIDSFLRDLKSSVRRGNEYADQHSHDLNSNFQNIKEKAYAARDSISDAAHQAQDKAGEILRGSVADLQDKSAELQENVVTYVKENPVKSIGFAMLAGILAAHLLRK
jgi:uncharacterized protein YjbJ (UPF0337 family)